MVERRQLAEVARYARLLHERGFVAYHDGNVSLRCDADRFAATPTGWSKRLVDVDDVVVVDRGGKVVRGRRRLFSEWPLHRAVYDTRPDARAVVHAHPPAASGFALAGIELAPPATAEVAVALGVRIPLVPFHPPGSDELERAVADGAWCADALLLAQHGVLTLGDDLEQAYLRMELVEHYARQLLVARLLGGERPLGAEALSRALESRRRAGLGPEARGFGREG